MELLGIAAVVLIVGETAFGLWAMRKAQQHFDRRLDVPVPGTESGILTTVNSDTIGLV